MVVEPLPSTLRSDRVRDGEDGRARHVAIGARTEERERLEVLDVRLRAEPRRRRVVRRDRERARDDDRSPRGRERLLQPRIEHAAARHDLGELALRIDERHRVADDDVADAEIGRERAARPEEERVRRPVPRDRPSGPDRGLDEADPCDLDDDLRERMSSCRRKSAEMRELGLPGAEDEKLHGGFLRQPEEEVPERTPLPGRAAPSTLQVFMRAAALPALLVLAGCAVSAPEPAETTSSTATAVVVVERTFGPGDAVRADSIVARFVRVQRGLVDDQALRVAGVALDTPALGTCTTAIEAPSGASRSVELLDVGVLTLEETTLLPRSMPDPAGVVSGVFYSGRATEAFTPGDRVQLRATGGADLVDGFSIAVSAPQDLTNVQVTDAPGALDVTWDAYGDPRDVIVIEVLAPGRPAVRCADLDRGRFVVPATLDEGQVVVHRLRREPFKTRGIEPGELRFDVARIVSYRRGS